MSYNPQQAQPPPYNQPPQSPPQGQQYNPQYGQQYNQAPPPQYGQPQYGQSSVTSTQVTRAKKRPVWPWVVGILLVLCLLVTIPSVMFFGSMGNLVGQEITRQATATARAEATTVAESREIPSPDDFPTPMPDEMPTEEVVETPTEELFEEPTVEATEPAEEPTAELDVTPTAGQAEEPLGTPDSAQATEVPNQPTSDPGIGSTAESGGIRVTLNSVRRVTGGFLPPDEGNEYIIVDLTFENSTDEEQTVSSLLSYSIRDDTGQKYGVAFTAETETTADGSIPPGDKLQGESAFEVPLDANGLIFVYDPIFDGEALQFKLDR